ncbi:MAG: hypothetical protein R3C32_09190 [Chloroflexota bacterium]
MLMWTIMFIFIHTVLVCITVALNIKSLITTGTDSASWTGFLIYALWMAVVVILRCWRA